MGSHLALLRAVNVGGTGKLTMKDLRALCEGLGFQDPVTYIQSGNVVFDTRLGEAAIKKKLEAALAQKIGKPTRVLVRSQDELEQSLAKNPFPRAEPNRVLIMFLDEALKKGALDQVKTPGGETLALVGREIYMHFPNGMGKSKLVVPYRDIGTARNLNTTRKMLELLEARA